MMGRPPKPTALKLLSGNPGKRPLNDAEPTFPIADVDPPPWLSAMAKREWRRLLPVLHKQGLFTVADIAELSGYCEAWAEVRDLTRVIRRLGRTYDVMLAGIVVSVKPRPEVAMRERAWARMHLFASAFGFSPSARTRIKATPEKEVDPFESFLANSGRSS